MVSTAARMAGMAAGMAAGAEDQFLTPWRDERVQEQRSVRFCFTLLNVCLLTPPKKKRSKAKHGARGGGYQVKT